MQAVSRASVPVFLFSGASYLASKLGLDYTDPMGRGEEELQRQAAQQAALGPRLRKLRQQRLKLEKERLEQRAREDAEVAATEVIASRAPPPAPDRRLVPGTPEYSRETERLANEARKRALAAAGGTVPPSTYDERIAEAKRRGQVAAAAAAPPAPAAVPAKTTLRDRAAALLANPFTSLALLGLPLLSGGGKKRKPAPAFEPLTAFESGSVSFTGELGGELALEPDPETDTRGDECEQIDPRRSPGECRQGWFSETPKRLYLKEWSRRPCR